jgi:hypothetical protein
MNRVLTSVSFILMLSAAPAFAQQGTTPDGRPMDPAGIQNKTPDGRPINPEGIANMTLTAQEEKTWFDKPVYSSDGTKIGNVAAFARGTDNSISEMHADIGGFLGLGETRVRLMPAQFKLQGDRVVLAVTAAQAKDLPKVMK